MSRRIDNLIPPAWETYSMREAVGRIPDHVWAESVLHPRDTFAALSHCAPSDVRVVILGQDPYPKPGKANGLAFGLRPEWAAEREPSEVYQSSFGNVVREALHLGPAEYPTNFDVSLTGWAKQGVLLLNVDLSVEMGKPRSHSGVWAEVMEEVVDQLPDGVVWLAWGAKAVKFSDRVRRRLDRQLIATHPCRYSANRKTQRLGAFIGCDHFRWANDILASWGRGGIKWNCRR